jgi:hypothetical protein
MPEHSLKRCARRTLAKAMPPYLQHRRTAHGVCLLHQTTGEGNATRTGRKTLGSVVRRTTKCAKRSQIWETMFMT